MYIPLRDCTRIVLSGLIPKLIKITCVLDPFSTKLLMSHLSTIRNIIICIVNLCFSSGVFPTSCKSSINLALIQKPGRDSEILKNYHSFRKLFKTLLQRKYMII